MTANTETEGGVVGLAFLGAKALGTVGKLAFKNRGAIKKIAKKGFNVAKKNKGTIQKFGKQALAVPNAGLEEEEQVAGKRRSRSRKGRKARKSRSRSRSRKGRKARKSRSRSRSRKGRKARKSRSRSRSRKGRKTRKSRSRSRKVTKRYASNVAARRRARALKMM